MQQNLESQWTGESEAASSSGFDVWGFVSRRKSIVIVLAIVGAGLGYLVFQRQVPQYASIARLELIHRSSDTLLDGFMRKNVLEDAMYVIPSPDVLRPAIQSHELDSLETLRGLSEDQAISWLGRSLSINPLSQGIVELRFTGPDRRDTEKITNAIAEEYIRRQTGSFESETDRLKRLLEGERRRIESQLTAAEQAYDQFIQQSVFLSTNGETSQPVARLSAFNSQIASLDIEEAEIASRLSLFEANLNQLGQRKALMMLIGKAEEEAKVTEPRRSAVAEEALRKAANKRRVSESLMPLIVDATILEQKVGPGHPRLMEVKKRIALLKQEFDRIENEDAELRPTATDSALPLPEKSDYLAIYRQSLQHELRKVRDHRAELKQMADKTKDQALLVQEAEQTQHRLDDRVKRLRNQYDSLARRIEQTEVNADMGGIRAKVIAPARFGALVYPIMYRFLGLGGFLGAVAGLGLAYLVELADRSFRKPEEVVREFGVAILGHIPYMKENRLKGISGENTHGMDRTLVSAHLPRSRPAEAYRAVRTALCFSTLGQSHRVVQVTSPAAGDGKSTLAANLAVSLAQSGKKTVLIESDFRRPSVHRITGVSNDVGVADVLRGKAELLDVVQELPKVGLHVIPCGRIPRNPSELLSRPEYEQLLEVLRDRYEYVIVDTPPVLVVTDPCSVAPRADGVLVCMRLSRHTRDFGRRAFDQLRDMGASVIGVVINGVEESDAYGYGNYNYSDYSSSYANPSFDDVYSYADANDAYFADDEEEVVPVKRLISSGEELADETRM